MSSRTFSLQELYEDNVSQSPLPPSLTPITVDTQQHMVDTGEIVVLSPSGLSYAIDPRCLEPRPLLQPIQNSPLLDTPSSLCLSFPQATLKRLPGDPLALHAAIPKAYEGISITDLERRAKDYQALNPGLEFDNKWLTLFAGKLTPSGKTVDNYRCYINGCEQTNKRRDHMVTHTAWHLGQRAFQCSTW